MAQSTQMQSMSKAARKQNGTQPELVRNSKHAVLPIHDHYIGQQAMFQDATIKHSNPSVCENWCPDSRSYKIQSNHMK